MTLMSTLSVFSLHHHRHFSTRCMLAIALPMATGQEEIPEWLLWYKECQHHIKALYQQAKNSSPSGELIEVLSTRIKAISNISDQLQEDNHALQDRVCRLEREINEQDSINNVKSQEQEQLKTRFRTQEYEFENVLQAVATMQRTNKVERTQYQAEMKKLQELVEGCVTGGHKTSLGTRSREYYLNSG